MDEQTPTIDEALALLENQLSIAAKVTANAEAALDVASDARKVAWAEYARAGTSSTAAPLRDIWATANGKEDAQAFLLSSGRATQLVMANALIAMLKVKLGAPHG